MNVDQIELKKNILIAGDHAGFHYKKRLFHYLQHLGYKTQDFGPYSEESVDYPDFIHPLSEVISTESSSIGILLCGSGNGVAMTANKHKNVRAALCWNIDIVKLARQHNDANIICIPARFVQYTDIELMIKTFLTTAFEGERHTRRVNKINC